MQLNNLELAVNLAKRANLPGAENLVTSTTSMIDMDASSTFLAVICAHFFITCTSFILASESISISPVNYCYLLDHRQTGYLTLV